MKKLITITVACTLAAHVFAQTPAQAPAPTSESLYKQGQAAEKAGDVAAARAFYSNSLKLNPNNANARYSIGQLKITGDSISAKAREAKFGAVTIPVFQLDQASLEEALEALSVLIEKESKQTVTPNFVVQDPKLVLADRKISLNLKNMPSKAIMKYLMDQTSAKARYDEHAIVISPL